MPLMVNVPIEDIQVGEHDQRVVIDDESLDGLVSSIGRIGLVYPCVVLGQGDKFILVEGHRRLAACKRLGKQTIDCLVKDSKEDEAAEIAFAGNFFRKDLSPVELASAISDVYKNGTMSLEQIAVGFHRSEYWVKQMVAICGWPGDILEAIHNEKISVSAGSNLACVTEPEYRTFLVRNAVEQGATARTTSAWLQAWRNMQPADEAIQAEPVVGTPSPQPIVPQAPCFCCAQVFAVNEMSHIPVCGPCVQVMRNVSISDG